MRLYGYPLQLIPFAEWLRQLDTGTKTTAERKFRPTMGAPHPLRGLRSFFLNRPPGAGGLTLPELYENGRRTRAHQRITTGALGSFGWSAPALDAALLDRYFDAFIRAGELPAPPGRLRQGFGARKPAAVASRRASAVRPAARMDAAFFSQVTGLDITAVNALGGGSEHSIVSELAGWRSHKPTGLFSFRLEVNSGGPPGPLDVIVKAKALDVDVLDVGEALARICDARVGESFARWRDCLGIAQSHERELAIYGQTDHRFVDHAPRVLGTVSDPDAETWLVVLERIAEGALLDSAHRPNAWTRSAVAAAIDGLASLQAIWYGREADLSSAKWIGYVPSAARVTAMADLWNALADHASGAFSTWTDGDIADIHRSLIRTIDRWWPALERTPRTLIHNDFNPRNICIRGTGAKTRLCAYDWELATVGAPQRDLAELLCFVLPVDASAAEARTWIERHRRALACETGRQIDAVEWDAGFRAALYDVLISRLATYALIHRVRPQRFLPRVVCAWRRLYEHFPLEAERS
jgi:aminoglycoside phosphotransferase (APT) family kinase protein